MHKVSFRDPGAASLLQEAMQIYFPSGEQAPVLICIGSERHILDCLGPLTGTMLNYSLPELLIYGTLDNPLHARNLVKEIQLVKHSHPDRKVLAIDASAGEENEIGILQLRQGSLIPGKALSKNLPPVGDYSLTGVVETRSQARSGSTQTERGLAHVFHMAKVIEEAVKQWYVLTK